MPFILFFLFFLILFIYNIGIVSFLIWLATMFIPPFVALVVSEDESLLTKKGWKGFAAGLVAAIILLPIFGLSLFDWDFAALWHEIQRSMR